MTRAFAPTATQGWQARLALGFEYDGVRTVLRRGERFGPLCVQRPFYPERDVCHVYILHPPGGIVGGDRLEVDVRVETDARALLTTPASSKVYRSAGPASSITQTLNVQTGAMLEWLPQDTILFGGSRVRARTEIRLARGARFSGWEVTALGRPHSGDDYVSDVSEVSDVSDKSGASSELDQRTALYVDDEPRLIEHQLWRTGDPVFDAPWGLAGYRVVATSYTYPADRDTLQRARGILEARNAGTACDAAAGICAATLLEDLLVVRALSDDAVEMRHTLAALWAGLRKLVMGRAPCPPRIWAT
ncbi:MAG: urease accessory protein UreD [Gammaproteobacteria bacterium]|nr:urease accessory protein UreD [Gammaproteobacteria bacterium]